ncbi:riboflavine-aldehyde-forming enzyme [Armillaria nabsnona]|nr:riboflavine-aldehyde-forming enzyme [Armillaria nabsnona]
MFSLKQSIITALALSVGFATVLTGEATWYTPNGGVGACGAPMQNSDHIVALSSNQYAGGAHCWKHIGMHYKGKVVDATIGDLCPGCGHTVDSTDKPMGYGGVCPYRGMGYYRVDCNGIDLSPSAFEKLAPLDDGRIQVTWNYE